MCIRDSSSGDLKMISQFLSLIHISEPTRPLYIAYAVFCLKKSDLAALVEWGRARVRKFFFKQKTAYEM